MKLRAISCCPIVLSTVLLAASGCASSRQKKFSSPDAAVQSLVDALRKNDSGRLRQILGPAGGDILSSGDKVADRADASRFLTQYAAKHRIQPENNGVSTLLVGEDEWPFPVPIKKSDGGYVFDTKAGSEEILNRRIGRNELSAEQVCLAIVDAQREYVRRRPMGGDLPEYARKVASDPGTRNGLFWPTADGEEPSPLGPLVASATAEGYGASARPYHGYCYRLLTSQGPHAQGGATEYLVSGRLVGGFAIVAYPAQYGNSGIMTFITNHDGIVYQSDLGPDTEKVAKSIVQFDPGPGWTRSDDMSLAGEPE